jgi:hypothetical protein
VVAARPRPLITAQAPLTATDGHAPAGRPAATIASAPPRFIAWYAGLWAESRPDATPAKLPRTARPPAKPMSIETAITLGCSRFPACTSLTFIVDVFQFR